MFIPCQTKCLRFVYIVLIECVFYILQEGVGVARRMKKSEIKAVIFLLSVPFKLLVGLFALLSWVVSKRKSKGKASGKSGGSGSVVGLSDIEGMSFVERAPHKLVLKNSDWLNEKWANINGMNESWYTDEPSDRQLSYLSELGVWVDGSYSKGQVSDLIGLFSDEYSDDQVEILKFFKVSVAGLNESKADFLVWKLMQDEDNKDRWKDRPLSTLEKAHMRFYGKKVSASVGRKEYEGFVQSVCNYDEDEDEDTGLHELDVKWDLVTEFMDVQSDKEFREDNDMKKVPLSKVAAYVKGLVKPVDDDSFEDMLADDMVDDMLDSYPEYRL